MAVFLSLLGRIALPAAFLVTALAARVRAQTGDAGGRAPHVVLIVADDLGWAQVGFHGSTVATPAIDRIAREGVELARFYTCPVCSPTRAGLMTGRYPIRFGMQSRVVYQNQTNGIPASELTLPEALAREGYGARGIIGKWHLGHAAAEYRPLGQGFTEFKGCLRSAVDYYRHTKSGQLDWWLGEEPLEEEGYVTDLCADAAVSFIERHAWDRKPFFLYLPFQAVHVPHAAPPELLERFAGLPPDEALMAAMVTSLDDAIGRVLDALDREGVADDTLVWFLSDNGGGGGQRNAPLRGHKSSLYEGGIRAVSAVRWPRGGILGGARIQALTAYIDVLPTVLRAAGGAPREGDPPLDGLNQLDALRGLEVQDREIYSYFDRGPYGELLAINTPSWKLVRTGAVPNQHFELFRIDTDPLETQDLVKDHPGVLMDLRDRLITWRRSRGAETLPVER